MLAETKECLIGALGEAIDAEIGALLANAPSEPHVFSKTFERRMDRLFRTGRPVHRARRAAFIAAAAILALVLVACTVPRVRRTLAGFFIRDYSNYAEHTFQDLTKTRIEEVYGLVPIPEGFEEKVIFNGEQYRRTEYCNADDDTISLDQYARTTSSETFDNEHGEIFEASVGGKTVLIRFWEGKTAYAAWVENGYYFSLVYSSPVSLEQFEEWIASVKIK